MKQIVVISGKGGTGKTVITASFAALANKKVMVDCDVDAADMHLILRPEIKERHEFRSGQKGVIDLSLCTKCGKCREVCRFKAVQKGPVIEPFSCEGCGLCARICPSGAIKMEESVAGEWFISNTKYGPFVHAKLGIAEENSGKLVAKIRQVARDIAKVNGLEYIIIDGPPGIGCPVIASLTGVDMALVVTEPTLSGLHDAKRVIEVARHFNVQVNLVINKYDLNPDMARQIEGYCTDNGIEVVGKIIFDRSVVESIVNGKTIIEYSDGPTTHEIKKIWDVIAKGLMREVKNNA
jgi:MinD superfamily P-loop ATPase